MRITRFRRVCSNLWTQVKRPSFEYIWNWLKRREGDQKNMNKQCIESFIDYGKSWGVCVYFCLSFMSSGCFWLKIKKQINRSYRHDIATLIFPSMCSLMYADQVSLLFQHRCVGRKKLILSIEIRSAGRQNASPRSEKMCESKVNCRFRTVLLYHVVSNPLIGLSQSFTLLNTSVTQFTFTLLNTSFTFIWTFILLNS